MGRLVYLVPISEQGRLRLETVQEHLDRAGLQWKEISTDDVRFKIKKVSFGLDLKTLKLENINLGNPLIKKIRKH